MGSKKKKMSRAKREARREAAEARQAQNRQYKENAKARQIKAESLVIKRRDKPRPSFFGPTRKARALPLFNDSRYATPVKRVMTAPTVRPNRDWEPKGRGPEALFRSYVRHRLVKYDAPVFLYQTAHMDVLGPFRLFCHLARGGSLFKAVKSGMFPVPFTKRMCHDFMNNSAKEPFYRAVRATQVRAYDGDLGLVSVLGRTRLGEGFQENEAFWATVIQWLCNHRDDLNFEVVPGVIDYLNHRYEVDPAFTMRGRSFPALVRGMEAWHAELAKAELARGEYKKSGYEEGIWEYTRKHPFMPSERIRETWTMEEILHSKDLRAEGKAQRHCVASYAPDIRQGRCSIWTMQSETEYQKPERHLTVRVSSSGVIVEARGKFNRAPTPKEGQVLDKWAAENNLIVRTRRW